MPIDSGDTAWLLGATALVMLMTPGVGFFYGGLVRRKNLVSMITLSLVAFCHCQHPVGGSLATACLSGLT